MGQLNFLLDLVRKSGPANRTLYASSIASGLLQGLLLYGISLSIEDLARHGVLSLRSFLIFALALAGLYKCLNMAMGISSKVARQMVSDLELRITDKLSQTSYAGFHSLDQGHIYEMISGSKDIVNEASIMLPIFISSCAMLLCSLIFSAFISPAGLGAVLAVMGLAALIFFYSDKRFMAALYEYRVAVEAFQSSLKDVIAGFTELKMNERRRTALFERAIAPLRQAALEGRCKTDGFRVQNTVMYGVMVYFPVGALLLILPVTGLATLEQCIKIVAITMFSTIPLIGLLSFMPLAARASLIVGGLEKFESLLDGMRDLELGESASPPDFVHISIPDGRFSYTPHANGSSPFMLTVRNFELRRNELVMLRGGNGSGKSTFMRLLAGLARLNSGDILVDGQPVAELGLARYRGLFSVLFPDFHLFKGLYGIEADAERCRNELARMALTGKVSVDEAGRFSTLALSSGQRKRLALACTLLEDRPVLLLDEVAADLDHHFREFFYRTLLPQLKAEGRTILAISHDDRYFDVADRVLTLQYGEFIETEEHTGP